MECGVFLDQVQEPMSPAIDRQILYHRATREARGGGEGGSAPRAREEGAGARRREGRPTSSATIIRLKQVQQLSPGPAAGGERKETTWTKL